MLTGITKLDVLIVDDERKACNSLRNLLSEHPELGLNVVGIAHNTAEAEELISKLDPDALFLDVEMPHENALHFLDRIKPFNFEVIFVTAYNEYAVRAFKLNAIDYILKPIDYGEFKNAVLKLQEKIGVRKILTENNISYTDISDQIYKKAKQQKIILKDNNTSEVIDFNDIYFIEAQSSYCKMLFLKDNTVKESVLSCPLSDYEEILPANLFYRIHKSYLVNCSHVKKMTKDDAHYVVVKDNYTLPVSRRRYPSLLEFLKTNGHSNEHYSK